MILELLEALDSLGQQVLLDPRDSLALRVLLGLEVQLVQQVI